MNRMGKVIMAILAPMLLFCAASAAVSVGARETTPIQTYFRTVETDAQGWTWKGFSLIENDKASRSWEHGTYEAGGTGEYRFKGQAVEIVAYKGALGGSLDIEIDGAEKPRVSLAADKDIYRESVASFEGLGDGWHTLKITSAEDGKWHAVDAIRVDMPKEMYTARYNLALVGNILCSVLNPTGGGNKNLDVVRNEKIYPVGTTGMGPAQYDSMTGGSRGYFYMGYSFNEQIDFSKLIFQEGDTWVDGGWFSDGDIKVQVRSNGNWKDVTLKQPTGYPVSDSRSDFGRSCEIYTFVFDTIKGDAIRLIGMTGGSSNFVSVSQIEVYASEDAETLAGGYDYRAATVYEEDAPTPPVDPDDPEDPDDPSEPDNPDDPNDPSDPSDPSDPKEDPKNTNIGLIVGLSVGGGVLVAGGIIGLVIYRKKRK